MVDSTNLTKLSNWNQCSCYIMIELIDSNLITLFIIGGQVNPLIGGGKIPWSKYRRQIKHIIIKGKIVFNEKYSSLKCLFQNCSNLESIEGLNNFDTTNITDMRAMFDSCGKLTKLDLSNWNTSNVTNISYIFNNCINLIKLNLTNWNTSKVIDMEAMFKNCLDLVELDVSNFNTSNVVDMTGMFINCRELTKLDLTRWNTSAVHSMDSMFKGCSSLTELDLSNWNTLSYMNKRDIFSWCTKLKSIDMSNFNLTLCSVRMFDRCPQLESLKLPNDFNTKYLKPMLVN